MKNKENILHSVQFVEDTIKKVTKILEWPEADDNEERIGKLLKSTGEAIGHLWHIQATALQDIKYFILDEGDKDND